MKFGEFKAVFIFLLLIKSTPLVPYSLSAAEYKHDVPKLKKMLIGDNGKVYACSLKTFYAFERNGTMAWSLPLNNSCSTKVAPVKGDSGQIFLVVINEVLKINPSKIGKQESPIKVFYSPEANTTGVGEIVGIAVSLASSAVIINVKKRGLFAFRLEGQLMWTAEPVFFKHDYRQGCRKNVTGCYFSSGPVLDHCEASIYMSNNKGELYSLSIHDPHFRWIQDFSSFGKELIISAGNNGMVYITIPTRALVLAVDASRGNVLWQGTIGPLSTRDYEPVVNIDGWISIGSSDGFLYSFSPKGVLKKFPKVPQPDSVIQVSPILDCSGYAVYISHTMMEGKISHNIGEYTYVSATKPKNVTFKMLNPASGTIYWFESYPGPVSSNLYASDLQQFPLHEGTLLPFIVASRYGNPFPCSSTYHKFALSCAKINTKDINTYRGNERSIMLFLLLESMILILLAVSVRFCFIFWKKEKLQKQDLGKFLEKRRSLQLKKKALDKTITELEQKSTGEAVTNEMLQTMNNMVKERDGITRKLSTSYGFRGDEAGTSKTKSLLPLHATRSRSFPFRGPRKTSAALSHSFSSDESSNEDKDDEEFATKGKGKAPMEAYSSGDDDFHEAEFSTPDEETNEIVESVTPLGKKDSTFMSNPLSIQQLEEKESMQSGSSIRRRTSLRNKK